MVVQLGVHVFFPYVALWCVTMYLVMKTTQEGVFVFVFVPSWFAPDLLD